MIILTVLPLRQQPLRVGARQLGDVGVEAAGTDRARPS